MKNEKNIHVHAHHMHIVKYARPTDHPHAFSDLAYSVFSVNGSTYSAEASPTV